MEPRELRWHRFGRVTRRTVDFSGAVVIIGLLAGLAGAATTVLLEFIEHFTYHYSYGSLLDGVS